MLAPAPAPSQTIADFGSRSRPLKDSSSNRRARAPLHFERKLRLPGSARLLKFYSTGRDYSPRRDRRARSPPTPSSAERRPPLARRRPDRARARRPPSCAATPPQREEGDEDDES